MSRGKKKVFTPLEQLQLYKKQVELLMSTQLGKTGFEFGFNIGFSNVNDIPQTILLTKEPHRDLFVAFLVIFRQFINNDEPIQQYKIYRTLHQYLTDEE